MCCEWHALTLVVVNDLYVVGVALPEYKANTPTCVHGHRPLAFAVSLELVQSDAFKWTQVLQGAGEFNADNKSNAPAKSKPRNWLGVSPSHALRPAALRHDWITAETYYGQRTAATAVSKTSRVLLKIKFEMPADEDRLKYEPGPNHCSRFT